MILEKNIKQQMNENQRLQLQQMISENNVTDQTDLIRQLKHSHQLRDETNKLVAIVQLYNDNPEKIKEEGIHQCPFLFRYYTDIFNKIRKEEINLEYLFRALHVLEKIENSEVNQHEASFEVGMILKEMYVDSAVRRANKTDAENDKKEEQEPNVIEEPKDISWSAFKKHKLKWVKKMNNKNKDV